MDQSPPVARLYNGRPRKPRKARVSVDVWCEILGVDERAVGRVLNLTIDGGRVVSPSAFRIGGSITLILAGSSGEADLDLKAQVRWLALNPTEGLFEMGFQFIHSGDSAARVERILRGVMNRMALGNQRMAPSFAKFTGGLEPRCRLGATTPVEVRKAFAAEGLKRLIHPRP